MARPLKVGIQLPEVEREMTWSEYLTMARLAEDVGFDSLWLGDHLLYRNPSEAPTGPWEVWTLLAGLAAVTDRIALGPLVACTAFHNPAMLAKKAATLDEIAAGRLILGLGAGWNDPELLAYGFPLDHRVSRFAEAFTIIRTLLTEGAIDFSGTFYQARDCLLFPRGTRPGGPPLMVGSVGPRMLRLTLPFVSSWNAWYADFGNTVDGLGPVLARVHSACLEVGRDPATLERTVALLVGMTGASQRASGAANERAIVPMSGSPEHLTDTLRDFARVGIAHVQLILDPNTPAAIEEFAPVLALLDASP